MSALREDKYIEKLLLIEHQQPVLDILAEMIAYDSTLDIRAARPGGINLSDIPNVGLD